MTVKLENLTDRPILLTLSSGEVLRISPRETSEDLEDVEVQSSTKIEKLVAQGVITMYEPRATAKKPRATAKKPRATAKKPRATAKKPRATAKKTEKASPQEIEEDDGKAKEGQ